MDEVTQTKINTMRQLLARWAEVEPGRCKKSVGNTFIVLAREIMHYCEADDLGERNLAWIQWAVQQAIVARGWYLETYYSPGLEYEARITVPDKCNPKAYSQNNMAEALLGAYLKALEASQ